EQQQDARGGPPRHRSPDAPEEAESARFKGPTGSKGLAPTRLHAPALEMGGALVRLSRTRGCALAKCRKSDAGTLGMVGALSPIMAPVTNQSAIVFVESSERLRKLITGTLRTFGYQVFDHPTADDAVAFVRDHAGPLTLLPT